MRRRGRRYFTVEVEAEAEVSFSEISTEELIEEIVERLEEGKVADYEQRGLADALAVPIASNLIDEMKLQYLREIYQQYSLEELEKLLPKNP